LRVQAWYLRRMRHAGCRAVRGVVSASVPQAPTDPARGAISAVEKAHQDLQKRAARGIRRAISSRRRASSPMFLILGGRQHRLLFRDPVHRRSPSAGALRSKSGAHIRGRNDGQQPGFGGVLVQKRVLRPSKRASMLSCTTSSAQGAGSRDNQKRESQQIRAAGTGTAPGNRARL